MTDETLQVRHRPELLAPAGKLSVFRAVLAAGADAAYVAGKQFNMRRHRSDFNFSMEELATATAEAHDYGKNIYVTVNSLVTQPEIQKLADYLSTLNDIGVDAFIVQDLAVVQLCHELQLRVPLHSSTMMNVSCVATARQLQQWGFTRLVTSRDITVADASRIKQQTGIEIEYFLHGDMCSALSGQCLTSGMIFGKSGNRGQCMKPCRWAYDLVSEGTGETIKKGASLLAARDLCLLQHIPQLIDAGIDSLKIEGRMRPAETLTPIIEDYRKAIDRTMDEPLAANKYFTVTRAQHKARTRNFTTGFAFRQPDESFVDTSGKREPIILSKHGRLRTAEDVNLTLPATKAEPPVPPVVLQLAPTEPISSTAQQHTPELTVVVGTTEGAHAALAAGCNHLILSWEANLSTEKGWDLAEIEDIYSLGKQQNTPVLMSTPRVLDNRSTTELHHLVRAGVSLDGFAVTSVGALQLVQNNDLLLWADASLNTLNTKAAEWLQRQGITRIMPAPEASLESIIQMSQASPSCQFDLLVHGPLTGMLLEHCLIAMHLQHASKSDFCPMPCAIDNFSMVDKAGNHRKIKTDRYCRNHIIMEHDLATLPYLGRLLATKPASIRIHAATYEPKQIETLIGFYRDWLDKPGQRDTITADFNKQFPSNKHTIGAYPLGIARDEEISRINLKREEKNADS